jgi:hypothetical protein
MFAGHRDLLFSFQNPSAAQFSALMAAGVFNAYLARWPKADQLNHRVDKGQ